MKRNDGKVLIPLRWEIVSCTGMSDKEQVIEASNLPTALIIYDDLVQKLLTIECSDVRLYVCDKQGYMECVKSWIHMKGGQIHQSDRLNEI